MMKPTFWWTRTLIAFFLVLPTILTGFPVPASGSQPATKQEADYIIVDRTTSKRAWTETREGILDRITSAFGEFSSDHGCRVGSGSMGDVSILPLGPNVGPLDLVSIIKSEDLRKVARGIYNKQQCTVVDRIEPQVLADSGSLWSGLVQSQLSKGSLSKVSQSSCQEAGKVRIKSGMNNAAFRFAIQSVERNTSQTQIAAGMCGLIVKVAKGISKIDSAMRPKNYCRVAGDGCSDVLSTLPVIGQQLSDLKHSEGRNGLKTKACVLIASDMVQVDSRGSLLKSLKSPDKSRKLAHVRLNEYIYGGKFEKPTRGLIVYMPYLGTTTPGVVHSPIEINSLRTFWNELFAKSGATVGTGSAGYACMGRE